MAVTKQIVMRSNIGEEHISSFIIYKLPTGSMILSVDSKHHTNIQQFSITADQINELLSYDLGHPSHNDEAYCYILDNLDSEGYQDHDQYLKDLHKELPLEQLSSFNPMCLGIDAWC